MAWNTDAVNQQMNTNPALRAELQNAWALNENAGHNPTADAFRAAHPGQPFESWMSVMKRYGIDVPPNDYRIKINPETGEFRIDRDSFWQRNKDWLEPSIAAGALVTGGLAAPAIAGALGGTAAAGGATSGAAAASAIPTTAGISGATALGLPVTAAPAFAGLTGAAAIPTVTGLTGAELGAGVTGADFAANAISPGADTASLASRQTVPNAGTLPTGTSPQGSGVGHDPTSYESILKQLLGNSANNNGIDWTSLALGGIGSALNAWAATQAGPQKRQSFRGTTADPVDILSGATKAIGSEAHTLNDLQAQPPELTGPGPQSLPTFTGGGMPMPIGVRRNLTPPLGTHPLSSQPATSDELDHLYSSLSMLGGKR